MTAEERMFVMPILDFDNVTTAGGHPYDSALWQTTLTLEAGDLMIVRLGNAQARLPLADAAQGLLSPDEGTVRFLGTDWEAMTPRAACAARGRIGRVFGGAAWITGLSVEENITLAQRHNTARPETEIRDEAASLARLFSLPGLPQGAASEVRRQDLQRAACVRAFLGKPQLLILEEPTLGVYPQIMAPLTACLRAARARGAAALWLTADPNVWNDRGIPATSRAVMSGAQLRLTGGQ